MLKPIDNTIQRIIYGCLAAILVLAFSPWAHAGGYPPADPGATQTQQQAAEGGKGVGIGTGGKAVSGSKSLSNASSVAETQSTAFTSTKVDVSNGVDVGVATGDVSVGPTTASTGPVVQAVTGPEIDIEGDTYEAPHIPVSTAYAPAAFSNLNCGETIGAAWQGRNGAGSLGIPLPRWASRKQRDCFRQDDANWLANMGLPRVAIEARCATKSMQVRFGGTAKGREARTNACVRHLAGRLDDQNEKAGLRNEVDRLRTDNRKLAEELRKAWDENNVCNEAEDRATDAWRDCLKGK